ncbi:LapA family protein [Ottowia sp.]|uniref:LapA family protein n=1 Tax=Ottowia sp. TaxID=1898956 RepID=UPI002BE33EFB|nr:LapA family protein [Ottowia sp.]HOB65299.1 LapA family protein [Ottowia sp.]HPZ57277.1 LapA family protein [Ottowia sp.]HQD47195.1 LapA family protein [Ottowia sp.]
MSLKSLLLLLIGAAIVIFVGLNWVAMTTPTTLTLGFTDIQAPLGLVLLGLMALLSVVFVALIAYTQGTVLMETRRHAKELSAQRELADKAEASRFTDLRAHLDKEITRLSEVIDRQARETLSRVDRAEMGLRERPVDAEITRLAQAVETHNRDLHARVDRLEMGLRDGLAGYVPAPATVRPAVTAALPAQAPVASPGADPVGDAVAR